MTLLFLNGVDRLHIFLPAPHRWCPLGVLVICSRRAPLRGGVRVVEFPRFGALSTASGSSQRRTAATSLLWRGMHWSSPNGLMILFQGVTRVPNCCFRISEDGRLGGRSYVRFSSGSQVRSLTFSYPFHLTRYIHTFCNDQSMCCIELGPKKFGIGGGNSH